MSFTFTYDDFKEAFPEFQDFNVFPPSTFLFWQGIADLRLDKCRWAEMLNFGAMLYIAHNMSQQAKALALAEAGGAKVGQVSGPVVSKTVDKISIAFNTTATTIEEAGDYNATVYGIQFFQLALLIGSGGRQF